MARNLPLPAGFHPLVSLLVTRPQPSSDRPPLLGEGRDAGAPAGREAPAPSAPTAGRGPEPDGSPAAPAEEREDEGKAWMLAFQQGEEQAFDRIVRQYQKGVFFFLRRTIRDPGRAEDLTQEVFLRVYRSRARYQSAASFRTWLFTIASRLALNEIRATRRWRRVFAEAGPSPERDASGDSREDFWSNVPDRGAESAPAAAERKELEAVVESLLLELPAHQRAAIQLHRSAGLSYQEIASALRLSTQAVKSLLVRARETLKDGMDRYFQGKPRPTRRAPP